MTWTLRLVAVLATAVALGVPRAWGAFDEQDRQLPWARDAALASAFSAVREGLEAAVYNPAALGFGEQVWLGVSGGDGGREADGTLSAAALWPVQDDLSLGLAYRSLNGAGGPGFGETSLGLGAAMELAPGLSLGLRPWWHQASSGALARGAVGFSLDGGVRWAKPWGRDWSLQTGWWASQLASEWPDRYWRRAVPVAQHAGLGLERRHWGRLGLGLEQSARPGVAEPWVVRLGLSATNFKRLSPSLGVSNDRVARYSAGAEVPWRWGRTDWVAAYAVLMDDEGGLRHRLQLAAAYPVRRRGQIVAVPLQVVFEPGTRKVRSATVSLNVAETAAVQEWELEIRDKSGRVVRVLKGTGTPPPLVTWDGKDALGEALADAEGLSYQLNIKTASGLRSSEPSYALSGEFSAGGLELLSTSVDSLVVPVTDADGRVAQLLLRPPQVPGETKRWQILIQDQAGNTLKTLEGEGPLPGELLWDGLDESGVRVLDQPGLRIRFNAWDAADGLSSVDQALDSGLQPIQEDAEPLPRLALKLPAFREGGPALTLMLSSGTLKPLSETEPTAIPTPVPTAVPTAIPTPVPTAVPTAIPTPAPTAVPTAIPTPVPTSVPTAVPTPVATAVREAAGIGAGLVRSNYLASPDLLPPVFMTREQAEGIRPVPPGRSLGPGRPRLPSAIDGVLDVFLSNSADLDPAKADRLQAFFWRLGGFKQRRLLLTGLVGEGETGSEELSRQRVRVLSRLMVEEGGFEGEFILKVEGRPGPQKGVRVEVLRR